MRVRALVALAFAWVLVAAVPAAAQESGKKALQDRLGAGPADAEPVHRPGRGGLPRLVDQLRPARQLQPEGPQPGRPASPRAGRSRRTRRPSPSSCSRATSGPTASRSPRRTSSTASTTFAPNSLLFGSYVENVSDDRHARRPDRGHPDQAARRADRRRPVRLHPARAHLGQGAGQEAHRLLPADAADRRQRALHRLRVPARAAHPDDPQPELHGQEAGVRRGPVDQVRQQRRRRPRAHAR